MAKKKKPQQVEAPRKIDLQKKAALELQIKELTHEMNEVSEEISIVSRSENDPTEMPAQTLYNLGIRLNNLKKSIGELRHEIRTNCYIESSDDEPHTDSDVVTVGDIVKIRCIFDADDIDIIERKLVSTIANSPASTEEMSTASPLGRAINKHRVGDIVDVNFVSDNITVSYTAEILSKR